jgi:colanic acid biosynthesis glycosyl transferase WcaI
MATGLAAHLASRGWEVAAITSRQRYDDARARLAPREVANGVHIERVWSTRFGRAGLIGRAIDYLTFSASAFLALRRSRDAVVIAMTDPPLLSVLAALTSRRVVNWLQDLFPEVAEALGIRVPLVRRLRDWSLRRAAANVVLGELMNARVPRGVVIHNWADAGLQPVGGLPPTANRQPPTEFSVGYS